MSEKVWKFYKTIEKRDDFGKDREKIFQLLKRCWLYPEYEVKHVSGGRDGDLSKETAEYVLFQGGYAGGMPSGMQAGVYQVQMCSSCQHLSVILCGEPEKHDIPEKKEAFQELLQALEGLDFTPKYSYLRDPKVILQPSFKKWLDEPVFPIFPFGDFGRE